jgi:hypothetical protein
MKGNFGPLSVIRGIIEKSNLILAINQAASQENIFVEKVNSYLASFGAYNYQTFASTSIGKLNYDNEFANTTNIPGSGSSIEQAIIRHLRFVINDVNGEVETSLKFKIIKSPD